MRTRLQYFCLALIPASWGLLLLSALSRTAIAPAGLGSAWPAWPAWTTLGAQAVLALGIFGYVRALPDPLRGQQFVLLLRRLVRGPGLLAVAGLGLHLLLRGLGVAVNVLFYTLNLTLFIYCVARVQYTWRALIFFRSRRPLRRLWYWFEGVLSVALLLVLFTAWVPAGLPYASLGAAGLLGLYLSVNQKWVAFLEPRQRGRAIASEITILGGLLLFLAYFRYVPAPEAARLLPAAEQAFLLTTAFFAIFFTAVGLLVALFNLPTAVVFEQRRAETLNLQRLMQVIQRGQTAADVCRVLLASTVETTHADAAWLDVAAAEPPLTPPPPAECYWQLTAGQLPALRALGGTPPTELLNNQLPVSTSLPFDSLLVQPLLAQGQLYATLYLLKTAAGGFELEDQSVVQAFVSQAELSLENLLLVHESRETQRVQDELRIAAQVQENLIPRKLPTDDWFELASYALAAREVGGDFYDLLLLPGRRLAVLIGDVSGKGVTAAFHMAQMKGIFHSLMQPNPLAKTERTQYPVPSLFMIQANAALVHCLEKSSFITASLFLIDYENGGFMFARAGHCHALYYSANQEKVEFFQSPGLGLGIIRGPGYEKHITNQFYDYTPGDVMVMYTDGIVEARDAAGQEYGEARLRERLEASYYRSAGEIKDAIIGDLHAFSAGQPMHDDQTLLVIKFKVAQPDGRP